MRDVVIGTHWFAARLSQLAYFGVCIDLLCILLGIGFGAPHSVEFFSLLLRLPVNYSAFDEHKIWAATLGHIVVCIRTSGWSRGLGR